MLEGNELANTFWIIGMGFLRFFKRMVIFLVEKCMKIVLPSPVDSMREAVFTVSPNRQYRGIFVPTIPKKHKIHSKLTLFHENSKRIGKSFLKPATTGPVWTPHRICNVSAVLKHIQQYYYQSFPTHKYTKLDWIPYDYRLGMWKYVAASSKSKAIVAISDTCFVPFFTGKPDATIYESPIVSTLYTS